MSGARSRHLTIQSRVQTRSDWETVYKNSSGGYLYTTYGTRFGWSPNEYIDTDDYVTPDFKKRIARGEIINNDFYSEHVLETDPSNTSFYRHSVNAEDGKTRTATGQREPDKDYSASWLRPETGVVDDLHQSVKDDAVQEAYANIDVSEMMALATAAEGRKTVDSLQQIMRKAYKIIKAVKRLDIKYLRKQISYKELQNSWMEARYALRPLIYDVNGLRAALETESKHYDRRTFRGFKSVTLSDSDTLSDKYLTDSGDIRCDIHRQYNITVSARAGVLTSVDVTRALVFGLDKIPETAWELLPFSFIVDWFVDVGQAIAASTPNAGVNQLASWCTVKQDRQYVNSAVNVYGVSDWETDILVWSPKWTYSNKSTTRYTNPTLYTWPRVSVNLNAYKINDLVNVLGNVLK